MIDDLLRPAPLGPRPPEDGFLLALRAARQRRWRTLRHAAACGTAAVAAVVATVTPRLLVGSVAGLEPATPHIASTYDPRPTSGAAPSSSATPSYPVATERAEGPATERGGADSGGGPYGGGPAAPPGPASGPEPRPAGQAPPPGSPEPSAWPSATEPPDPGPYEPAPTSPAPPPPPASPSPTPRPPSHEPVDLSYENQSPTAPCESSAWCLSAQVAESNGVHTLVLRACRPASDTSGVLSFTKENEADFRITSGGKVVWQWSTLEGADPDHVHTVAVDRWQCAVWSTPWYANDLSGDPVAPGSYTLGALPRAGNLPRTWQSRSFTVS